MIVALIGCLIAYIIAQVIVNSKSGNLIPPSGNLLIFDTETNGLPNNWKASLYDTNNWPRIVSISWIKIAPTGEQLDRKYYIIKPDGFVINSSATAIHGISNDRANTDGLRLIEVLKQFEKEVRESKYLIAHNIEFDYAVTFAEFTRANLETKSLSSTKQICTMKQSTDFCRLPSNKGYKYPKLNELHQKLFSTTILTTHDAETDAETCMKCFKELYNQKIIKF